MDFINTAPFLLVITLILYSPPSQAHRRSLLLLHGMTGSSKVSSTKKRTLSSFGGVDTQAVLSHLFSSTPDANNPRSTVSDQIIHESLNKMCTYKVSIPFTEPEDYLASEPPGKVSLYTPYVDVGLDRLISFSKLYEVCKVDPSLAVFTI